MRWPHRRRADMLSHLFAGGVEAIALTIDVDRPLSSYGVGFDNTRFAAALRLAAPIPFYLFAGGAEPIDRTIEVDEVDRPAAS